MRYVVLDKAFFLHPLQENRRCRTLNLKFAQCHVGNTSMISMIGYKIDNGQSDCRQIILPGANWIKSGASYAS